MQFENKKKPFNFKMKINIDIYECRYWSVWLKSCKIIYKIIINKKRTQFGSINSLFACWCSNLMKSTQNSISFVVFVHPAQSCLVQFYISCSNQLVALFYHFQSFIIFRACHVKCTQNIYCTHWMVRLAKVDIVLYYFTNTHCKNCFMYQHDIDETWINLPF